MTRFSEIAHDIESQYDPDYDLDASKTAPPVRYIEYRLLELCETLDARLTALEAKPQAPDYWRKWAATEVEIKTAELDAARAERNALAAEVDDLRNVNAGLRQEVYQRFEQSYDLRKENERLTAEVKQLASDRKTLSSVWHALKIDNERLADQCARLRAALEAVEWGGDDDFGSDPVCLWCKENRDTGHDPYCQRQAALR